MYFFKFTYLPIKCSLLYTQSISILTIYSFTLYCVQENKSKQSLIKSKCFLMIKYIQRIYMYIFSDRTHSTCIFITNLKHIIQKKKADHSIFIIVNIKTQTTPEET